MALLEIKEPSGNAETENEEQNRSYQINILAPACKMYLLLSMVNNIVVVSNIPR